jgi:circadian clock protein KaiC
MSPELDQMLGGGLRRGTSTLLIGPAGSGKSSIALSYVVSAARRGDQSMLFAFDEGVGSVLERGAGLGMDIEPFVESGVVRLQHLNPADISPGEFNDRICGAVGKGARIVVIDSLNGYMKAMPHEAHLVIMLHELLEYLAQRNVLTIMTVAMHGMIGQMQTPVDVSYLSDNVLMLRFFEHDGRILKAISVMKKRVGSHEETIREFRLSDAGLVVGKPLQGFQGIMSGIPTFRSAQPMLPTKD